MFQKWLIAFLADRGWRYLRQRQTRKQLQHMIKKRGKRLAKRVKQKQVKHEQGFRPGRALTLLALGIGAWAYVRSRQANNAGTNSLDAFNDRAPQSSSSIKNLSTREASGILAAPGASSTAPETTAPTYQEQASVPQSETLAVPTTSTQAEEPTYAAQAARAESTLAVPTTHTETNELDSITSEGTEQELRSSAENVRSTTDEDAAEQQHL